MGGDFLALDTDVLEWVFEERGLAARGAEVVGLTLISGGVSGSGDLHEHAADGVAGLGRRNGYAGLDGRRHGGPLTAANLNEFGQDAGGDLVGRDGTDVEAGRRLDAREEGFGHA